MSNKKTKIQKAGKAKKSATRLKPANLKNKKHTKKIVIKRKKALIKTHAKTAGKAVKKVSSRELAKIAAVKAANESVLEEVRKVGELVENRAFLQNIDKNVGTGSTDILRTLIKGPHTDEDISTHLSLKVNDVRRMLNVMNGYSIVRYDVNKDNKGWLIFRWRIDREKLKDYISNMEAASVEEGPVLPGDCNDFFMCKKCYSEQKVIVPFDSAFESGFTCGNCGKPYTILNKEQTVALFNETASSSR